MEKPKSNFGWWFGAGLLLGVAAGASIGSMTIGIPMGLSLSFLAARISDRIQYGITRMMR